MNIINKDYCMSLYLAFRFIEDENLNFYDGLSHIIFKPNVNIKPTPCATANELDAAIQMAVKANYKPGKTAIFLSGGMDSAIIASYMPEGTPAYTFKCIADGAVNETTRAKIYAKKNKLNCRIVEMYWEDFERLTPDICRYNQTPFHSIEIQLCKAIMQAKADGIEHIFIGESADLLYGGMHLLLAKDWEFEEFVKRYTFLDPARVLQTPVSVMDVYERYRLPNDKIDFLRFMDEIFSIESSSSYAHMFSMHSLSYTDPYTYTKLDGPLDLFRIRNGEPKYLIRELFSQRYPDLAIPDKITMPRATDQWLKDWTGPTRKEFKQGITGLTGDQKWQLYCLEVFLNEFDKEGAL